MVAACTEEGLSDKLGLFLRKGDTSFQEQKYQEAIAWYEQVTQADATHAHAFTMLAAAHYMAGGINAAMKNFDKALDIEPKSVNALLRSGQLHLQVCSLDRASADIGGVLAVDAGNEQALVAQRDIETVRGHLRTARVRLSCSEFMVRQKRGNLKRHAALPR